MGGIIFILAAIFGYLVAHLLTGNQMTASALLVIGLVVGLGFVGFLDDWLKVSRQNSRGLKGRYKLLAQAAIAGVFGYAGLQFSDHNQLTPISQYLSTVKETSIFLGMGLVIAFVILMVMSASNGVNLTDGLDGLATGATIMTFLAFVLIGVWEFGQSCAIGSIGASNCYQVRDPLDLAVLAAAFAGGCTGFLWWNTAPAKIIMGDTGSLALGAAIAGFATTLRVEMLLIPLGGLFVIVTMSVVIQTLYFKISGGKRVFRMAPLHHHFELKGWAEITVVIRFWIIAGLSVAGGLGLFYAQWVVK
jgi:phospho-N-acetylmuramoyl-pentapeptide-transferase